MDENGQNSGPLREELVQMAAKFLSNATVRNSPDIHRRLFLENRGLRKDEIDEAFRRVPDPPSNMTTEQNITPIQDEQSEAVRKVRPQVTALATSPQSRFYWTHAFVFVGFLAVSCAGTTIFLKNVILPRLKSWIRKADLEEHDVSAKKSKPSLLEEVTAAAKSASSAAADVAKASMEILNIKNKERQYLEALVKRLEIQVAEMRSISNATWKLENTREAALSSYRMPEKYNQHKSRNGPNNTPQNRSVIDSEEAICSHGSSAKDKLNSTSNFDGSGPSSAPASMGSSVGQHPKSYMEILAMIQRGETPPGIKEIDDSPPNPDQPLPNPHMAPRIKPWEVAPPNNNNTYAQDLGSTSQLSGDKVVPWWHRKNSGVTEPPSGKITNLYNEMTEDRPVHSSWVPHQPSSIAMHGAAHAIRHS